MTYFDAHCLELGIRRLHWEIYVKAVQRELLRGTVPSRWWLRGEPWYEEGAYEPCYPGVAP